MPTSVFASATSLLRHRWSVGEQRRSFLHALRQMHYQNQHVDRQFQLYFNRKFIWSDLLMYSCSLPMLLVMPFILPFTRALTLAWLGITLTILVSAVTLIWHRDVYIRHRDAFVILVHVLSPIFGNMYIPLLLTHVVPEALQGPREHPMQMLRYWLRYAKVIAMGCHGIVFALFDGWFFPLRVNMNMYRCLLGVLLYTSSHPTICRLAFKLGVVRAASPSWFTQLAERLAYDTCEAPELVCSSVLTMALVVLAGALVLVVGGKTEVACRLSFEREHHFEGAAKRLDLWPANNFEHMLLELCMKLLLFLWLGPAVWDWLCGLGLPQEERVAGCVQRAVRL